MSTTHFSGPTVPSTATLTVATVPDATISTGGLIYVTNGANGSPVIAFSNGASWLRVDTLGVILAT